MADKKKLFQPQLKEKWLFGMEPLEPIPLGPHCKRWYKTREKLPTNYLAKHRNKLPKCPVDSQRWLSVREGLDNLRMGCPPADNLFIRGRREGFLSRTAHRVPKPPPRKTQNKLSKGAELSKLSPVQQARKAFVEELKASLTLHSLDHYPDLKKILPPDLLLMVLEEIDPDKKLEDTWAYCEGMKDKKKSPAKLCEKYPEEVYPTSPEPSHPGTSQPTRPGTSGPSQPGPPNQVNLGPPSHVNRDLLNKSTWDLPANSTGNLLNKSTGDLLANSTGELLANSTGELLANSTGDLPAKSTWEQLVKSSWDLLAKSTRNSRPSQLVLPSQVNQGPPKQISQGPPKQISRGPPKQVNRGPPKQKSQGPPKQVNWGPPNQVTLGPPDHLNQGPPNQLNQGPPGQVTPGPPGQVTLGALDQVNQEPPKDSFLSYLMKLFPEEKKKKKSSRKSIPKNPDPYRYEGDEVSEFCRWTDTFEDMDIDEKFITKQFEIDDKCMPNHNMGKIKKVTQIPVELYYSKELDDIKKSESALQEGNWERKLRKPPYPYRPNWAKVRYGEWYLNPKISKKQINDEPWVGPKVLKEHEYQHHGRDLEPDILDDLYGPIAFKDFIVSKGYRMPGVIEKLFSRKKWSYDSVKTPIDRVMKLLSKGPDDTSDDIPDDD
ncbi:putative protein FAM47D [Glossophaga mutica]